MKKTLFSAITAIALACFALSCTTDRSINGTTWSIDYYEDYLDGKVVFEGGAGGMLDAKYEGESLVFNLTGPDLAFSGKVFPGDYNVKKYKSNQLVADLWYEELLDITMEACTFKETFNGLDIYSHTGYDDRVYFMYFKSGKAVKVNRFITENGEKYYYDTRRISCSPVLDL